MKNILKTIIELFVGIGTLYGFYKFGFISPEVAIIIGVFSVIFIVCFHDLKDSISPIADAIAEIQKWLADNFKFVPLHEIKPTGYIGEKSPLDLTELGTGLLNESGAKNVVDTNYRDFERLITEQNCRTAYDVQEVAGRIIAQRENDLIMSPLKDFAYRNPRFRENPLTFVDIQRVMTIYLRNLYLHNHPQILQNYEAPTR